MFEITEFSTEELNLLSSLCLSDSLAESIQYAIEHEMTFEAELFQECLTALDDLKNELNT